MNRCPHCGERVKLTIGRCKYCGEYMDEPPANKVELVEEPRREVRRAPLRIERGSDRRREAPRERRYSRERPREKKKGLSPVAMGCLVVIGIFFLMGIIGLIVSGGGGSRNTGKYESTGGYTDTGKKEGLSRHSEEKFGLSEEKRRAIYREFMEAERRADEKAQKVYPLSPGKDEFNRQQIDRQIDLMRSLTRKYIRQIRERHGITVEQQETIDVEAIKKGWYK